MEDKLLDDYYDAMELIDEGNLPKAEKLLENALLHDDAFVAAHVGMVAIYRESGYDEGVRKFSESGFEQTAKHFPTWPKKLPWGVVENRQYLRAICNKATLYQYDDENEQAEQLYRLLLELNPHDNQGIRYLLAGMYTGLTPREVDAMFDEANDNQDWSVLEQMVNEQNFKFNFWKQPKD